MTLPPKNVKNLVLGNVFVKTYYLIYETFVLRITVLFLVAHYVGYYIYSVAFSW